MAIPCISVYVTARRLSECRRDPEGPFDLDRADPTAFDDRRSSFNRFEPSTRGFGPRSDRVLTTEYRSKSIGRETGNGAVRYLSFDRNLCSLEFDCVHDTTVSRLISIGFTRSTASSLLSRFLLFKQTSTYLFCHITSIILG